MSDVPVVFDDGSEPVTDFYYEPCENCCGIITACSRCRGARVYQFRQIEPSNIPICRFIANNCQHHFLFTSAFTPGPGIDGINDQIKALEGFIKRQTKYRYDKQAFDAAVTRAMLSEESA